MDWFQPNSINWNMVSSLAAVSGVIVSVVVFWKSYSRLKKIEQIKIVYDIEREMSQLEDILLKLESIDNKSEVEVKNRAIQYLNVCEWYSLLVNNGQIYMQDLIDHFAPKMCCAYKDILGSYPDLKEDETKFKQFRTLCKRLKCGDNQSPKLAF